ncbi:superoxide dismutase [Bdellovibrio bacteriovorus]|uniref:Superoxide dismutase [Cu-Zn] n=1 Tax=Bdellovibrio bacteriovorus TaxID=959 RepID=A0A162GY37_BDEBC|nr:superoxide dismutase family protein [Bdellovibrio bacteriovorus]KYG69202.1 superoxide dismutase [Bdellovibrio bacteriovorus]
MKKILLVAPVALIFAGCSLFQKKTSDSTTSKTSEQTSSQDAAVLAPTRAQAVLKASHDSKVKGIIHFTEDGNLKIETMAEGLKPGPHGFHIHEVGDCSKGDFSSAGGHFNPTQAHHGAADSKHRHAGDLGNLMANNKGKANVTMTVEGLTLKPGPNSIIGKSVIIHKDKDDLKSQPAGNSGPRIACGVIEAVK